MPNIVAFFLKIKINSVLTFMLCRVYKIKEEMSVHTYKHAYIHTYIFFNRGCFRGPGVMIGENTKYYQKVPSLNQVQ